MAGRPQRIGGHPPPRTADVPSRLPRGRARDQTRGHYCGPGRGAGDRQLHVGRGAERGNKYTQAKIAAWMRTDDSAARALHAWPTASRWRPPERPVARRIGTGWSRPRGHRPRRHVRRPAPRLRSREHQRHADGLAIPVKPHERDWRFHLEQLAAAGGFAGPLDRRLRLARPVRRERTSRGSTTPTRRRTRADRPVASGTPMRHIGGMIRDHTQRFVW